MNRIAELLKISEGQFAADVCGMIPDSDIISVYNEITLPVRATTGSAGYDFFLPFDMELAPMKTIVIPTGIRARIDEGWMLMIAPRSGLGFKYRFRLDNTVGIIDSDYYNADNEGHIKIKLTNESLEGRTISLKKGTAFAQGIFLPYGVTYDDEAVGKRTGGFGSTG